MKIVLHRPRPYQDIPGLGLFREHDTLCALCNQIIEHKASVCNLSANNEHLGTVHAACCTASSALQILEYDVACHLQRQKPIGTAQVAGLIALLVLAPDTVSQTMRLVADVEVGDFYAEYPGPVYMKLPSGSLLCSGKDMGNLNDSREDRLVAKLTLEEARDYARARNEQFLF